MILCFKVSTDWFFVSRRLPTCCQPVRMMRRTDLTLLLINRVKQSQKAGMRYKVYVFPYSRRMISLLRSEFWEKICWVQQKSLNPRSSMLQLKENRDRFDRWCETKFTGFQLRDFEMRFGTREQSESRQRFVTARTNFG